MRLSSLMVVIVSVASLTAFAKSSTDEPVKPKSEDNKNTQVRVSTAIQKKPAVAKRNRTSTDNVQGLKSSDRRYRIFD